MKIEKINDNQIKCTLNKSDLASRQIKISELAYGTEKAKSLFRDMMQQASVEFGFDAEDIPLMIEAIPLSADSIILVITKVEDPEELDTRFSRFAPSDEDSDMVLDGDDDEVSSSSAANDLMDMLKQVKNRAASAKEDGFVPLSDSIEKGSPQEKDSKPLAKVPLFKIYSFKNLNSVITVANQLKDIYTGDNSLYKSPKDNNYYLIVNKSTHSLEEFSSICCVISEYGNDEKSTAANEAYCKEHFEIIIKEKALQKLQLIHTRRKN